MLQVRGYPIHYVDAHWFGLVMMEDFSITSWLLLVKIFGIVLFIFLTAPTSSHALMRAAFEDDEMPL